MIKLSLIVMSLFAVSCSSISTAPSVSNPDKKGNYLVVVNKTSSFLGFTYQNLNEILRCNYASKKCSEVKLVDGAGNDLN